MGEHTNDTLSVSNIVCKLAAVTMVSNTKGKIVIVVCGTSEQAVHGSHKDGMPPGAAMWYEKPDVISQLAIEDVEHIGDGQNLEMGCNECNTLTAAYNDKEKVRYTKISMNEKDTNGSNKRWTHPWKDDRALKIKKKCPTLEDLDNPRS
eukprot:2460889-Ditylum_brightwellii.AAC.1